MTLHQLTSNECEQLFSWLRNGYGNCDEHLAILRKSQQAPNVRGDLHVVDRSEDGRLLSHVAVAPKTLRIGKSYLSTGLISAVYTAPEARRQGRAERLMAYLHEKFADSFDLFYLSSSPVALSLYARSGYTIFLSDYVSHLTTLTLLNLEDDVSFQHRSIREQDIPWMSEMYKHAVNDRCSWSVVRDNAYWRWVLEMARLSGYLNDHVSFVIEKEGTPCGYVIGRSGNYHGGNSEQEITLLEVCLGDDRVRQDDERIFRTILHRLALKAASLKVPCVCVGLDRYHPLTMYCRLRLRAISEDYAKHDMVYFHDVPRFLRAMTPELEDRLSRTQYCCGRHLLKLKFRDQAVHLEMNDGKINVTQVADENGDIHLGYPYAGHILSGYLPCEVYLPGQDAAHAICSALFPTINGWFSHVDSY